MKMGSRNRNQRQGDCCFKRSGYNDWIYRREGVRVFEYMTGGTVDFVFRLRAVIGVKRQHERNEHKRSRCEKKAQIAKTRRHGPLGVTIFSPCVKRSRHRNRLAM